MSNIATAAQEELLRRDMLKRFDAYRPGSRPTEFQQTVIDDFGKVRFQYIVAGNRSGKSQLGAWLTYRAWSGQMERHEKWGSGPLTFMLLARTTKIADDSLWPKIAGFMDASEYRVIKSGQVIQKVIHRKSGNILLFQSHHSTNEARQKIQSFELCGLWLDEEPGDIKLIEEAQRRLQDRRGFFIATFTSKSRNVPLQKLVDRSDGVLSKRYKLKALDNPIYTDQDKREILASIVHLPKSMQMAILEGDWMMEDTAVYNLKTEYVCRNLPSNYSKGWVHVEGADPAMSSKHGTVVWAQDPESEFWYLVRCALIQGIAAPSDLVDTVARNLKDLNISRRVADSASDWYIKEARKMGYHYMTPYDKNNRKSIMMKNLQERLGRDLFITEDGLEFLNELQEMQWAEGDREKIVNDRKYHLHYAGMYSVDRLPKSEKPAVARSWEQMVHDRFNGKKLDNNSRISHSKTRLVRLGSWKGRR